MEFYKIRTQFSNKTTTKTSKIRQSQSGFVLITPFMSIRTDSEKKLGDFVSLDHGGNRFNDYFEN